MRSNKRLIEKADFAVQDLIDDGGYLLPEQADRFIRKAMLSADLLGKVRVRTMNSPRLNINKIFFNKRIMRVGVSATALVTPALDADTAFNAVNEATARAKPKTEQIQLLTHEYKAQVDLPYDVLEDSIESGGIGRRQDNMGEPVTAPLKETILTLMAAAAARDLQELALLGDTAVVGSDPYLGDLNGWIKKAEGGGNIYNANGGIVSNDVWTPALKLLPEQYRSDKTRMGWICANDQQIEWQNQISQRQTALGDQQYQGGLPTYALGINLSSAVWMPQTKVLLTLPLNLIWGVQRQILVEYDRDIQRGVLMIVLTLRCDFAIEEPEAVVVIQNLGTPA